MWHHKWPLDGVKRLKDHADWNQTHNKTKSTVQFYFMSIVQFYFKSTIQFYFKSIVQFYFTFFSHFSYNRFFRIVFTPCS